MKQSAHSSSTISDRVLHADVTSRDVVNQDLLHPDGLTQALNHSMQNRFAEPCFAES